MFFKRKMRFIYAKNTECRRKIPQYSIYKKIIHFFKKCCKSRFAQTLHTQAGFSPWNSHKNRVNKFCRFIPTGGRTKIAREKPLRWGESNTICRKFDITAYFHFFTVVGRQPDCRLKSKNPSVLSAFSVQSSLKRVDFCLNKAQNRRHTAVWQDF